MALAKLARDLDPPVSQRFPAIITKDIMTVVDGAPIGCRDSAPMLVSPKLDVPATPSIFHCTVPLVLKDTYKQGENRPADNIQNYRVFRPDDPEFFWERIVLRLGGYSKEEIKQNRPRHHLFGTFRNPRDLIKSFAAQLNKKADTFMNFVTLVTMQYWMIAQARMLMYDGVSEAYPRYLWALSENISTYDPKDDEHRDQAWSNIWDEARLKSKAECKENGVSNSIMTRFLYRVLIHEIGLTPEESSNWCRTKIKQQSQNFYPSRSFTAMSALKQDEDPEIETTTAKFHRNVEYKRKEIAASSKEPHHKWTYQAHRMIDPFKPLLDITVPLSKSALFQKEFPNRQPNEVPMQEILRVFPLDTNNDLTLYICLEMARCTQNTELETNYKTKYKISEAQIRQYFATMEPSAFYTWYLGSDGKRKGKGTEVRSVIKLNRPKPLRFTGKITDRPSHWTPPVMTLMSLERILTDPSAQLLKFGRVLEPTHHIGMAEFATVYRRLVSISHFGMDSKHLEQYSLSGACVASVADQCAAIRVETSPRTGAATAASAGSASKKRKRPEMEAVTPVAKLTQMEYERLRWLCQYAYQPPRKTAPKAASGLAWERVETKEETQEVAAPNLFRAQLALWLISKEEKHVVRTLFDIWAPKNPDSKRAVLDHTRPLAIESFYKAWRADAVTEFQRRQQAYDKALLAFAPPEPGAPEGGAGSGSSSGSTQLVATSHSITQAMRDLVAHFHGDAWSGHDAVTAAVKWMNDKIFCSKPIMSALLSSFHFRLLDAKGVAVRIDEADLCRGQLIQMLTSYMTSAPATSESTLGLGKVKFVASHRHQSLDRVSAEEFPAAFTQAMYEMLILPVLEWIEVTCPLPGPRFENGSYFQESPRWLGRHYSLIRRAVSGVRAEIDQPEFKSMVDQGGFLQHWPQKTSRLALMLIAREELGDVQSEENKELCQNLDLQIDALVREYVEMQYSRPKPDVDRPKLEHIPDYNGGDDGEEERPIKRLKLEHVETP